MDERVKQVVEVFLHRDALDVPRKTSVQGFEHVGYSLSVYYGFRKCEISLTPSIHIYIYIYTYTHLHIYICRYLNPGLGPRP